MKPLALTLLFAGALFARPQAITEGTLTVASGGSTGAVCPLKHTTVKTEISGFLGRTTVTQEFENTLSEKIEAVYTFPLPQRAAVDDMTMIIGDRTIRGLIRRREEARAIYEAARNAGKVASLLDQERPNIFTQSVTNLIPGARVKITISYVETLKYEDGTFEFVFPMVVGPRYIPGNPTGRQGGGWAPDTDQVPDASRITPPVAVPGTRAGHTISVQVTLDAGIAIGTLASPTHDVVIDRTSANRAVVTLKDKASIPNKDFLLRYTSASNRIEDALLTHQDSRGGFFSLIVTPPPKITPAAVTPKELVFVLDTSGSMSGFPIEKAKEAMQLALKGLYPQDTFNLITFAGDTQILFPQPVPATAENLALAQSFLAGRSGRGGTEMMRAIKAALDSSDEQSHIRIVCFMTDGFVGNDMAIIHEVQKHHNARVFSFGIGSSVNRFLLDKIAEVGRGEVEYVGLSDDGSAAARRFHERVRNPLLTDITIDWGGLPVSEIYPSAVPDLFGAKPIILAGRYSHAASGTIKLRGRLAGQPFERSLKVNLPATQPAHDSIASLWAREKIEHLMGEDWIGLQNNSVNGNTRNAITQLGLDFRLMTQFTSFVAVEERVVTDGGQPRTIQVPVEMPEGVSHEGVFGEQAQVSGFLPGARQMAASPMMVKRHGWAGATDMSLPAPPPPPVPPLAKTEGRNESTKLEPRLAALAAFVRNQPTAKTDSTGLMKDGKVEVRVTLAEVNEKVLADLQSIGLEITFHPTGMKMLTGRIAAVKLEALSRLASVAYVQLAR